MAETLAQIGYETELRLGNDASPQVFNLLAEVVNIDGFGVTLDEIEVTHMQSPNRTKEYISALKDGDEMTVTCNCIRENAIAIKNWTDAGLRSDWQIIFPGDLENYQFPATPKGFRFQGVEPNGALQIELRMKIAGALLEWS